MAFGVDALRLQTVRRAVLPAALAVLCLIAAAGISAGPLAAQALKTRWVILSVAYAGSGVLLAVLLCRLRHSALRPVGVTVLMVGDALLMFWLPQVSGNRGGTLDLQAVRFLQNHIGLSRA